MLSLAVKKINETCFLVFSLHSSVVNMLDNMRSSIQKGVYNINSIIISKEKSRDCKTESFYQKLCPVIIRVTKPVNRFFVLSTNIQKGVHISEICIFII